MYLNSERGNANLDVCHWAGRTKGTAIVPQKRKTPSALERAQLWNDRLQLKGSVGRHFQSIYNK